MLLARAIQCLSIYLCQEKGADSRAMSMRGGRPRKGFPPFTFPYINIQISLPAGAGSSEEECELRGESKRC